MKWQDSTVHYTTNNISRYDGVLYFINVHAHLRHAPGTKYSHSTITLYHLDTAGRYVAPRALYSHRYIKHITGNHILYT
jgi:hypothetical protein